MRKLLVLLLACGALLGATAPSASAVQYNYGGPMCAWAGPYDGVYWRWSQYYGVWYIYSYTGGPWRYYVVQDYWGTWRDTWARPTSCGA